MITFDEFAYNLAIALIAACDGCRRVYLASLPDTIAVRFAHQLQFLVETEGKMSFVRPFLVSSLSAQEIHEKREKYEPRLDQLCQAARERIAFHRQETRHQE